MEIQKFLVDFEFYCKTCKYKNLNEVEDPCNRCLDIPARDNSKKPEYYKEGWSLTPIELTQKEIKKLEIRLVQARSRSNVSSQEIENLKEKIRLKVVILKCLEVYQNMPVNQNNLLERS